MTILRVNDRQKTTYENAYHTTILHGIPRFCVLYTLLHAVYAVAKFYNMHQN
jgi:hypothetical protein